MLAVVVDGRKKVFMVSSFPRICFRDFEDRVAGNWKHMQKLWISCFPWSHPVECKLLTVPRSPHPQTCRLIWCSGDIRYSSHFEGNFIVFLIQSRALSPTLTHTHIPIFWLAIYGILSFKDMNDTKSNINYRKRFRSRTSDLWTDAATVVRAVREESDEKESEEKESEERER